MTLRTALKQWRKQKSWTQEELARLVGASWSTVARWEMKNGSEPSKQAKRLLADLGFKTPKAKRK